MSNNSIVSASCAKCGACGPVCPVFRAEGRESLTARGKLHLLALGAVNAPSDTLADILSCCLLCGACEQVCPRQLPITRLVAEARSRFLLLQGPASVRKAAACAALARPCLLEGLLKAGISLRHLLALPKNSGLRLKLALAEERPRPVPPLPENMPQLSADDLTYFVGCFARHVQPSIAAATENLLRRCGLAAHVPADQCCCGLAAWSCGSMEQSRELAQRNIAAFSGGGAILTSCASCSAHLLAYPNLFAEDDPWRDRAQAFANRVREFTDFFTKKLVAPSETACGLRVFYHDPCHLRFQKNGMKNPRKLLNTIGCLILEPENGPLCCGQGGLFRVAFPTTAANIFASCSHQVFADQPDCVTTTCSGCLMRYQEGLTKQGRRNRVAHLAVLLEEAGGGEICA